jgi:hypothetical protein
MDGPVSTIKTCCSVAEIRPRTRHQLVPAECPKRHRDDVAALFPGTPLEDMLVIPTCQHAVVDLVQMGERVETEKDRLLERVSGWVGGRTGERASVALSCAAAGASGR